MQVEFIPLFSLKLVTIFNRKFLIKDARIFYRDIQSKNSIEGFGYLGGNFRKVDGTDSDLLIYQNRLHNRYDENTCYTYDGIYNEIDIIINYIFNFNTKLFLPESFIDNSKI